ncbi:MAG: uroporphyrinogen-III C-methyltransferase, partial [Gammaproteobacteria bacterium]|nr:uroporphyrinogen-III C-methyltransferase [Gammaproteobacteria bacterium]
TEKKPAVAKDNTSTDVEKTKLVADKKTGSAKPGKATATSKPAKSSNAGVITLILIVTIGMAGGLYLLWEEQQQILIKQRISSQNIEQQLASLQQAQIEANQLTESRIKEIHEFQENLRINLTNLIRNKEHLRNDWLMAEAEYLVQLANHRLLLEKDVATAAVALKAADARLAEVADPALLSVRKILAKDLQTLNNIPTIDLAGLSVTLSALTNNIPNLPLNTPDPKTHKITQTEKTSASSEVKSVKDLPRAIWKDIKSLIVIRHHEKPLQPLLAPEQHFFLVQNLGLLLEQSRLALLNGHNEIYQERLATTEKLINQYFDTGHNVTRNMLSNIAELQKFDIDPALPDISSTFSAIKKFRTQGQQPEVNTVKEVPAAETTEEPGVKEVPAAKVKETL